MQVDRLAQPPAQPPALIAIADAPLWQDRLQRHALAFAVGRLASAFAAYPGAVGLLLRRHDGPVEFWLEALAELHWLGDFGFALGISAPKRTAAELAADFSAPLHALRRAGVHWLQIGEGAAEVWMHARQSHPGELPLALARSCHDLPGVERALGLGASWVSLSPLLATPSKPGHPGLGWAGLDQAIALYPNKIVALGGLGAAEVAQVWQRGASAAVLRAWQLQPRQLADAFGAAY